MGQTENGLSNAEYASWMVNTASDDCTEVEELYIKYTDDSEETLTDNSEVCSFLSNATETQVATFQEVNFSGTGSDGSWNALDERVTTNLQRVENNGVVPIKIKRPIDH